MARYRHLFSLAVTHEFHAGGAVPGLRYEPAAPTAELMRRERLLLRAVPSGVELWQEEAGDGITTPAPAAPMLLRFEVLGDDPLLRFYTDWPLPAPLRFSNRLAVPDDGGDVLLPLRWRRRQRGDGLVNQMREPLFRVDIAFRPPPPGAHAAPQRWRLALASRKIHWKYFFSGALASKQLHIVDLNAAAEAQGVSFGPALPALDGAGSAYLSALALPIQQYPQQNLQLREVGAAGKVLIKRLPNASVEKMGKERGPNGQSMIVAEIYIHQ